MHCSLTLKMVRFRDKCVRKQRKFHAFQGIFLKLEHIHTNTEVGRVYVTEDLLAQSCQMYDW